MSLRVYPANVDRPDLGQEDGPVDVHPLATGDLVGVELVEEDHRVTDGGVVLLLGVAPVLLSQAVPVQVLQGSLVGSGATGNERREGDAA